MTGIPQHLIQGLPPGQRRGFEASNRRLAALKGWARRRADWSKYLALHGNGERMTAFIRICDRFEPSEYWSLLRSVWADGEFFDPRELWTTTLSAHPEHRQAMMVPDEVQALEHLPEIIDVYRGAGARDDLLSGFSWTLDRERAVWFSARFGGPQQLVARGRIRRQSVIALIEDRGEREIIALPNDVDIGAIETINTEEAKASLDAHGAGP